MNRDEKAATIEEIAAQIEGAESIFAVDYRGISVPQAAELRGKLREADASFRVVKNRLTKLAAKQVGEERLDNLLQGPTALAFVRGDTALAAKAISNFTREHEILAFKGGFMDGLTLDEDRFKSIARLPGRDVLNGQLAGIIASPVTGLVRGLGSMIQGLALQLGQIAEKGLVSGGAPPAEPESGPADAPVEEPPTESPAENEPPAEGEPSQAEGDDADAEPAADKAAESEQEETDPPASGSEAEEAGGNGGDESPSEEGSNSDSSPASEGEDPAETSKQEEEEE